MAIVMFLISNSLNTLHVTSVAGLFEAGGGVMRPTTTHEELHLKYIAFTEKRRGSSDNVRRRVPEPMNVGMVTPSQGY